MPRPRRVSDQQILEAAQQVFLRRGVSGSTIEIAKRAGVSEGLLFKRYGSKEALFAASMRELTVPAWVRRLEQATGREDPRALLLELAPAMLTFYRQLIPKLMMSWAARPDVPASVRDSPPPLRDLPLLVTFFARQMRAGRLRRGDPETAARTLQGALFYEALLELTGVNDALGTRPDQASRVVDLLLTALEPTPRLPRKRRKAA